jgi:hypothetical protein
MTSFRTAARTSKQLRTPIFAAPFAVVPSADTSGWRAECGVGQLCRVLGTPGERR